MFPTATLLVPESEAEHYRHTGLEIETIPDAIAGISAVRNWVLKHFTEDLGMTAFIETHDQTELERALELEAKFVGVNARDLSTFETDRHLFGRLVNLFPADVVKVAESAVRNADDVKHYRDAGADVVLVGEALVTGDASATLKSFLRV